MASMMSTARLGAARAASLMVAALGGMSLAAYEEKVGPVPDDLYEAPAPVFVAEPRIPWRRMRHGKRDNHPRAVEHRRLQAACKRARTSGPMRGRTARGPAQEALRAFRGAA